MLFRSRIAGEKERAEGREQQEAIRKLVRSFPNTLFQDRNDYERALDDLAKKHGLKLGASLRKAILSALSERDETAANCRDKEGNAEPDPDLRDTENVPLSESIETFFARKVKPHVPDAWIDTDKRDTKDGEVWHGATIGLAAACRTLLLASWRSKRRRVRLR